jgi:hypothetical protein
MQLQLQLQNTGVLHFVQDDDVEQATAEQAMLNKQRRRTSNGVEQTTTNAGVPSLRSG